MGLAQTLLPAPIAFIAKVPIEMSTMKKEFAEPILADDYPVYAGYAYVADGKPIISDIQGNVLLLKRCIGAQEIRRCDLVARGLI
jgi:hypothetical protein